MNRGKQTLCATGLLLATVPWCGGCKHCCKSAPPQDPFAASYSPGAVAPILPGGGAEFTPQPSLGYPVDSGMPQSYPTPSTFSTPGTYTVPPTYSAPQTYNGSSAAPSTVMPGGTSDYGAPMTLPNNQPTPTPALRPHTSSPYQYQNQYQPLPQTYPAQNYPTNGYSTPTYQPQSYRSPQPQRYYPQPGSYSQPNPAVHQGASNVYRSHTATSAPSEGSSVPVSPIPASDKYRSTSAASGDELNAPSFPEDSYRSASRSPAQLRSDQPAPQVSRHVSRSISEPQRALLPQVVGAPSTKPPVAPAPPARSLPQDPIPLFTGE